MRFLPKREDTLPTAATRLPGHYIDGHRLIKNMAIGATGWTVPWAMHTTPDGSCYLNPEFTIEQRPGGTVCMQVGRDENGWIVNITDVYDKTDQWRPDLRATGIRVYAIIDASQAPLSEL